MSRDKGDAIGTAVGRVAREAAKSASRNAKKASNGRLSGTTGLAAGAGLAALAPIAARSAGRFVRRGLSDGAIPIELIGDKMGGGLKDAVGKKVDDAGGAAGIVKEAGKGMVPGLGGGGDGGGKAGAPTTTKGRRMPIQQAVDVGVPIETAYNQFTQFEDWPKFMHRVERVAQDDDTHVKFKTKIWGKSKEFTAEIVDQTPDERIKWRVTEGVSHTGVVTFHKLGPRLTRVDVDVNVHPGSLIEKMARGMRHMKRAVRADLARYKAYIELEAEETGAWRGTIEDGDVKRKTDPSPSGGSKGSSRSRAASPSGRSRAASSGGSSRSSGSRSRSGSSGSGSNGSSSSRSRASSNGRSSSSGRKKAASSS